MKLGKAGPWHFPDDEYRCWIINNIEVVLEQPYTRNKQAGWFIVANDSDDDSRFPPRGPYSNSAAALMVLRLLDERKVTSTG